MTWTWRWLTPWRRQTDPTEAGGHLARLEGLDDEVAQLGRELREIRRRNHFSRMVAAAIARSGETVGGP